jgi:predicted flap endonuclease-1-like 5' DNA nuclease
MAKIEEIEGIGPTFGQKLRAAGIKSIGDLLKACCDKKGRKATCDKTGIDEDKLLKWANHADLMRIKGIGPEFSELLEAAGVDTCKELKNRKPENLAAKMAEVNAAKKLTRQTPSVSQVTRWVEEAGQLQPVITH